MDQHFPISQFDAVYVVDLCKPLLDIAQARFAAKGWTNVICICQDATTFTLPEWSDGVQPKGSLGFITMSYSLSMVSHSVSTSCSFQLTIVPSDAFVCILCLCHKLL